MKEGVFLKNVIHIFGASGSGTTTPGKIIACELLRVNGEDTAEENFEKIKKYLV